MRNFSINGRRAGKKIKSFLAILLTFIMIIGAFPITAMAASYTVNRVSNLNALSKTIVLNQGAYEPLFISRLRNPQIKITNSDFKTGPRGAAGTSVYLTKDKAPTSGTKSFSNVFTVTYKDVGYTPSTAHIDLKVTMTNLDIVRPTSDWFNLLPETTRFGVATIEDDAISAGSVAMDNSNENTAGYSAPYMRSTWKFELTDAETGKVLDNVQSNQVWKDLDVTHRDSSGNVGSREGVTLLDGWSPNTYLTNESDVKVSNDNATYQANKNDVEGYSTYETDQKAWVMAVANKGTYTFIWTGAGCGTVIQKVSDASYDQGSDPVKSVNVGYIKDDEVATYTITKNFASVPAERAAKSTTVTDPVNKALTVTGKLKVLDKDNNDVTSKWNTKVEGNTITYNTTQNISGVYKFQFQAKRSSVDVFSGGYKTVTEGDTEYAVIPNKATVSYIDQHDVTLKQFTNTVNVKTPKDEPKPIPHITLDKIVKQSVVYDPEADVYAVDYEFVIKNDGEALLKNVNLTDELPIRGLEYLWENTSDKNTGKGELAVGESVTAKAQYVLTKADIDNGSVLNTATAYGTDENGETVNSTDDAKTLITTTPSIDVQKTTAQKKIVNPEPGDLITYDIVITNNGKATLKDIAFDDDHELESESWDAPFTTLDVNGKITGQLTYALTEDDINAGKVVNTITVEGTSVSTGNKVTSSSSADTTIITTPSIAITKTAEESVIKNAKPGDQVRWLIEVVNNGKNMLSQVSIDEALNVDSIDIDWANSSVEDTGDAELAIGEHVPAVVTYTLTMKDIMDGKVENTATAVGVDPFGETVTSSSTAYISLPENPSATLTKTIVGEGLGTSYTVEGDTVVFELRGTNDGEDTLYNVKITDQKEVFDWEEDWSGATEEGTLEPGEYVVITCKYALTQDDIDAEELVNTANLTGENVRGTSVDVPANAETPLVSEAGADLFKVADPEEMLTPKAGDTITYNLEAVNTKAKTLYNATITDKKDGVYDFHYVIDDHELAPGEKVTAQCKYDITQEDIDRGYVDNPATFTSNTKDGTPVDAEDEARTILHRDATLVCTKDTVAKVMEDAYTPVTPSEASVCACAKSIPLVFSISSSASAMARYFSLAAAFAGSSVSVSCSMMSSSSESSSVSAEPVLSAASV